MLLKPGVTRPHTHVPHPLTVAPFLTLCYEGVGSEAWRCVVGRLSGGGIKIRAAAGGGVVDKPITTPKETHRTGTSRRRPPIYRVMLHNDNYNSREYVVRVLVKVIDCLTLDDAVNVMQVAHVSGIALVTACAQEEAETYCQGLRNNGLTSTIEPDGGTGNGAGA